MSRLTDKNYKGQAFIKGLTYKHVKDALSSDETVNELIMATDKLAEYEDLEEQGLLIKLPCKVGDAVWKIKAAFSYYSKPIEDRVDRIIISNNESLICCTSGIKFTADRVGNIVFFAYEEALAKLNEYKEREQE